MKLFYQGSFAAMSFAALVISGSIGVPVTAVAAGGIKAAYVETVIPSKSFHDSVQILNSPNSMGPLTGVLGVSSIILTNFDSGPQQVIIFAPIMNGGSCTQSNVIGFGTNLMEVYVQPFSTLVLPFPSPLVINPTQGATCIAAEVATALHGGSVRMDVTGFVN